jgi:uncharacterized membrane protein
MNKNQIYLVVILSVISTSVIIPAYAEVTSLQTSSSFYKAGDMIQFSGTTLSTDPHNVTILIFDPTNKFVLLVSGTADNNNAFQVSVDTSLPSNQQIFSLKGLYNATAFVANKIDGKTVSFAFSPDGSSLAPSPPTNMTAVSSSPTEIDLSWLPPQNNGSLPITGYKIERNDGSGFNLIANLQTTTYQDMSLIPNSEHSYRVSTINAAGTSLPSTASTLFTLPPPTAPAEQNTSSTNQNPGSTNQNSNQSLSDILQQRYAAARQLQELLNGQNSNPSSNPSSNQSPNLPQNTQQTIQLDESIGVNDLAANLGAQKSMGVQKNNLASSGSTNFATSTILYPMISLVGVGIVVTILYLRKKRKTPSRAIETRKDAPMPIESTPEKHDWDYAMTILKNRLAKGEITLDEFRTLKDELSES